MRQRMIRLAGVAAAAFMLSGAAAQAQPVPQPERQVLTGVALTDAQARLELNYLSPAIRAEVERRATGGNTVRGVMETMLLNSVSQAFAAQKVLAVDFIKGMVTFEGPGGQVRSYPFDVTLLQVKS